MVKIDKKWCYFHLKWCYLHLRWCYFHLRWCYLHLRWCYLRQWLGCSIDFAFYSLKFCGKSKKNCVDISQVSPAFCMYVSVLVFWLPALVFVLWGRSLGAGAKPNPPPIQVTFNGHLILTRYGAAH